MDLSLQAEKDIKKLKIELEKNSFKCNFPSKKNYNFEFSAEKNGIKNKVLIYFGKKGLKTVVQGNSESREYYEIQDIVNGNYSLDFSEQSEDNYENYIGTDETGKGDYFGPLVAAGFSYSEELKTYLLDLGVRDSKELTDTKINQIAIKIKNLFPKRCSVIAINPKRYNELYGKLGNINEILNWAHSKAVENISKYELPEVVITDQFSKKSLNIAESPLFRNTQFIQKPRAESYLGVASASILARHEMNKWFESMGKEGFELPKGASNEVKRSAKKLVNKLGRDSLALYVKIHFKITNEILKGMD